MSTIRVRGDKFQAIIRIKKDGAIVHQESEVFTTRRLAQDWADRVEAKIKMAGLPQRQLKQKTLGALMLQYLDTLKASTNVRRTRESEIEQIAAYFMHRPLNQVESSTLSDFARQRRTEGAGPTTVLHNLATIRSIMNAAKPMYGLSVNGDCVGEAVIALKRVGTVKNSSSRERRPSADELAAIAKEFERIKHHPSLVVPMQIIVPLAVELPRRLGELTAMTWADLNKPKRIQVLRDTKHPSEPRDEMIPLPPKAFAIINALPVIDARILPYKSESISAAFQRCCLRIGISDLHFHDLRHEGISRLFEQGLSIQEVALISGHKSWVMLRRYTHPSVTALSEKLNAGIA
jgi:integrase